MWAQSSHLNRKELDSLFEEEPLLILNIITIISRQSLDACFLWRHWEDVAYTGNMPMDLDGPCFFFFDFNDRWENV
jgi:hypothetical protein